jgi:hypothetical protein
MSRTKYLRLLTTAVGLCFMLAAVCLASAAEKPDFSGNWIVNLDRSNFGKAPKPTSMSLKVTRNGDVMHAVQTTNSQAGSSTTESDWVIDGKEHDTTGTTAGKTLARWEGNTLYSERKSNDGSLEQKIWLTLSADGRTANEKVVGKGPEGTNTSRLIWERQ